MDAVKQNDAEAISCQSLYYPNCYTDQLIEKYVTVRPKPDKLDLYCSYEVKIAK